MKIFKYHFLNRLAAAPNVFTQNDIDEYHEVAELAEEIKITVEQLEREQDFRNCL